MDDTKLANNTKKTKKWPFFPKIDTFVVGFHYFDYGMDFKKS